VAEDTANFLRKEIGRYYYTPLTPHPDDRTKSFLRIDAEELGDIAETFCNEVSRQELRDGEGARLSDDPSLTDVARWLDACRNAQISR
jgi:hypothetical protein